MTRTRFSIVIPTRNRASLLRDTLHQLSRQKYPVDAFEVIVVDNAPKDDSTQQLVKTLSSHLPFRLQYILATLPSSSIARNIGFQASAFKHVLFLDDDLRIQSQLLAGYHEAWKRYADAQMIGGEVAICRRDGKKLSDQERKVVNSADAWCLGATTFAEQDQVVYPGGALVSANMSYRKTTKVTTLFDEHIGRLMGPDIQFGSEDYELCQRLINTGQKLVYVADQRMRVYNRVSSSRFTDQYLNTRYWLHGMELRLVETKLLSVHPHSLPIYKGFLWWELTHWPGTFFAMKRFATNPREWIRLLSYLWNGKYLLNVLKAST